MLTSRRLSSTALHCTPHLPTVNAQIAVIERPAPLKRQVEKVERGWGGVFRGWRRQCREAEGTRAGTRRDRGLVTIGWPLCQRMPRITVKQRQRRAFGGERRTVGCGGLTWVTGDGTPGWLAVRASAFEEAMWYWIPEGRRGARSMI